MILQPFTHLLDVFVILRTKFFKIDSFHVVSGFGGVDVILPGTGEELVDVVVQVALCKCIPFVLIKPDTIAVTTTIQIELGVGKDLVVCHDVTGIGAEFQLVHVPSGIHIRSRLFHWRVFTLAFPPGEIDVGVDPHAAAVRALLGGQVFHKGDGAEGVCFADGAFHEDDFLSGSCY